MLQVGAHPVGTGKGPVGTQAAARRATGDLTLPYAPSWRLQEGRARRLVTKDMAGWARGVGRVGGRAARGRARISSLKGGSKAGRRALKRRVRLDHEAEHPVSWREASTLCSTGDCRVLAALHPGTYGAGTVQGGDRAQGAGHHRRARPGPQHAVVAKGQKGHRRPRCRSYRARCLT